MPRGKKIAAALVMLGLGLAVAMLFKRTEPATSAVPAQPPAPEKEALILRESLGQPHRHTLSNGVVPLKPAHGSHPPHDLNAPIAAPRKPVAPPELPAVFDRSLATPPKSDPRGVEALAKLEARSKLSVEATIPQGPTPLRIHRIVDGDTLASLAQRFLGDANRYEEIHALNESELPDPNILPIGVALKIPPRDGALLVRTQRPIMPATPESASQAIVNPLRVDSFGVDSWGNNSLRVDSSPPLAESGGLVPVPAGQPHE